MATVTRLDHLGPLRVHGRVLRRGRNSVVAGLDVVDEGPGDAVGGRVHRHLRRARPGGAWTSAFERPAVVPMPRPVAGRPAARGVLPHRARGRADHPAGAGRPPPQPVGHPPRGGGGHAGRRGRLPGRGRRRAGPTAGPTRCRGRQLAAADTVLHYLRPVQVGPVEARCRVLGGPTRPTWSGWPSTTSGPTTGWWRWARWWSWPSERRPESVPDGRHRVDTRSELGLPNI